MGDTVNNSVYSFSVILSGAGCRSQSLSVVIVWSSDVQHTSEKVQCLQRERSFERGRNSVKGRSFVKGRSRKPERLLLRTRIHQALTSEACIFEGVEAGLAWPVDNPGLAQTLEHLEQQGGSSEERRLQGAGIRWSLAAEQKHCRS